MTKAEQEEQEFQAWRKAQDKRIEELRKKPEPVIDYVDLKTGERFSCTENELMARNS